VHSLFIDLIPRLVSSALVVFCVQHIVGALLQSDVDLTSLITRFQEFTEYDDVRYFTLKFAAALMKRQSSVSFIFCGTEGFYLNLIFTKQVSRFDVNKIEPKTKKTCNLADKLLFDLVNTTYITMNRITCPNYSFTLQFSGYQHDVSLIITIAEAIIFGSVGC